MKLLKYILVLATGSVLFSVVIYPFQPYPFNWVFIRSLQVSVLLSILLYARKNKMSPADLGMVRREGIYREVIFGFCTGIISILLLLIIKAIAGALTLDIDRSPARYIRSFTLNLPRSFLIAFLEEIIFRGFLIYYLRKYFSGKRLVLMAALYFAVPHFFRPLPPLTTLVSQFVGIFIVGCLLAWIYIQSGALYLSMGLHAGWIYFLKLDGLFVDHLSKQPEWLYGNDWMVSCVLGWPFLLLLFPVFLEYIRKKGIHPPEVAM